MKKLISLIAMTLACFSLLTTHSTVAAYDDHFPPMIIAPDKE
ncbi:hypothetical protein [Tumebacillus avium]|nr:hypothetical protein [Tumebacillus avium]